MVDAVDRLADPRDVPLAAALGDKPAAGLERSVEVLEQPVVVGDPVEGGGGEDRVDGRVEHELREVGDAELDLRRQLRAGLLDHGGRAVDADHAAVRQPLEQRRRHPPGAAARVEHPLVPGEDQAVEYVAPQALERGGHALVGVGVPVARRHTFVRYRLRSNAAVLVELKEVHSKDDDEARTLRRLPLGRPCAAHDLGVQRVRDREGGRFGVLLEEGDS